MSAIQMEETAKTTQPLLKEIAARWSPRKFANRPVEPEKLLAVLEAASWAPSSFNEQPWRFIVARREDREEFEKMLQVLKPGNVKWAKDAPVLMVTVASLNFAKNDKPNRHAFHDVGLASQNLAIQATHLGLAIHYMAGFEPDKAVELFDIPDGYKPVAAAGLGYFPEDADPGERSRRALEQTVYTGEFGKSAGFLN